MAQSRTMVMVARVGLGHLLDNFEDSRRWHLPPVLASRFRRVVMNGWMWVTILGRLWGCIYTLGVPWGVLHLALHEILFGREANLVS
jgi:hypothetical protein